VPETDARELTSVATQFVDRIAEILAEESS
jgi:hypothetical protein